MMEIKIQIQCRVMNDCEEKGRKKEEKEDVLVDEREVKRAGV